MALFRIMDEVERPVGWDGWRPILFVFVAHLAMMDGAWPESGVRVTGATARLADTRMASLRAFHTTIDFFDGTCEARAASDGCVP